MSRALPWLCVAAWSVGALLARRYGVWTAIGTTALVLGALSLIVDGERLTRSRAGAAWGLLGGLAMTLATYALSPSIARAVPRFATDASALYGTFTSLPAWLSAALLVPIIASEELVWRGVVQASLAQRLGALPGALVAALVYALAHAPVGSPVLVVAALGCGLAWSALRMTTDGLVAPFVAHLVWDFAVLLVHPIV